MDTPLSEEERQLTELIQKLPPELREKIIKEPVATTKSRSERPLVGLRFMKSFFGRPIVK